MILSGLLVNLIVKGANLNETLVKFVVDSILFFLSFFVQRQFIFTNEKK